MQPFEDCTQATTTERVHYLVNLLGIS